MKEMEKRDIRRLSLMKKKNWLALTGEPAAAFKDKSTQAMFAL